MGRIENSLDRQQIQFPGPDLNHNKGLPQRPRTRHIQSPIKTWQRKFSYQTWKMRIRKIFNNLARIQNYPIGNIPIRKKDRLYTKPKTPKYIQKITIPHGLNTPAYKIYTKPSQLTRYNKTTVKKREHNKQQNTLGERTHNCP